jgi:hypothetical protein
MSFGTILLLLLSDYYRTLFVVVDVIDLIDCLTVVVVDVDHNEPASVLFV